MANRLKISGDRVIGVLQFGVSHGVSGGRHALAGKLFFMSYYGDKIWDKSTKDVSEQTNRGDPVGLALTEHRLSARFMNWSVPFSEARRNFFRKGYRRRILELVFFFMRPFEILT